jgi:putative ABC transport system permease protein
MDFSFLASFLLVLLAVLYSYKEKLGIEKKILTGSVAAFFQLIALGFVLSFLLAFESLLYYVCTWLFMVVYASFIAKKRIEISGYGFFYSFLILSLSSFVVMGLLIVLGVIEIKAKQIIPLSGMIVGNALNVYTQFADRLKGEVRNRVAEIEGKSALGAAISDALSEPIKSASKASMLPTLNTLHTVGLIHIPGVTVGMVLAGADPMKAVAFQMVIMFMMVAVAMFSIIFAKILLVKKILACVTP